jgi:hypothetical protein
MSAVVGFAVLGAIPFLPLYLQVVNGQSPVHAGIEMTPVTLSLVVTSVVCGRLIARRGRYKVFPIGGSAAMVLGLVLLARMTPHSGYALQAAGMALLGIGIGSVVQVLILTAQNSVTAQDLGVATSTATFFRSLGASAGVATFGAVFTSGLAARLGNSPAAPPPTGVGRGAAAGTGAGTGAGTRGLGGLTPSEIRALAPATRDHVVTAFSDALHLVYLAAVPVALVALLLAFAIREVPLRVRTTPAPITE